MEVILFCIGWYMIGVVGCVLGTLSDLSNRTDFNFSDLIMNIFIALFGPVTFSLGLVAYATSSNSGKFNKTLIKGKK